MLVEKTKVMVDFLQWVQLGAPDSTEAEVAAWVNQEMEEEYEPLLVWVGKLLARFMQDSIA